MNYVKGFLPSWLAPATSTTQMNNTSSSMNTGPARGRRGSRNGAGSGSSYSAAMRNKTEAELVNSLRGNKKMMTEGAASSQYREQANGRAWAAQQFATNTTQNNQTTENLLTAQQCSELLNHYGITNWQKYENAVELNKFQKLHPTTIVPTIPDEHMQYIHGCAKWLINKVSPQNQQVGSLLLKQRTAEGLAKQQAANRQAAAQQFYRSEQQALTSRYGTGYGGKRKNKTRRSKKTKKQTRRR